MNYRHALGVAAFLLASATCTAGDKPSRMEQILDNYLARKEAKVEEVNDSYEKVLDEYLSRKGSFLVKEKKKENPIQRYIYESDRQKKKRKYESVLDSYLARKKDVEDVEEVKREHDDSYRPLGIKSKKIIADRELTESEKVEVQGAKSYHLGDISWLEEKIASLKEVDPKNKNKVIDNLEYFVIAHYSREGNRDKVLELCKNFLKEHQYSELFTEVADMYYKDPLIYGQRALTKEKINKIFKWFDAIQDLVYLTAVGGGDGLIINTAASFGMKLYDICKEKKFITYNEREALKAFLDFQRKYPNDEKLADVQEKISTLIKKNNESLAKMEYDWGEKLCKVAEKKAALRDVLWANASLHYDTILEKYPQTSFAKQAKQRLDEVTNLIQLRKEEKKKALTTIIGEETLQGAAKDKYYAIELRKNLIRSDRDAKNVLDMVRSYRRDYPYTKQAELRYAEAIAYNALGRRNKSERILENIVSRWPEKRLAQDIKDMLENPDMFPERHYDLAIDERSREVRDFILKYRKSKENLTRIGVFSAAGLAADGLEGLGNNAAAVGAIPPILKAVSYGRDKTQVSYAGIMKQGCKLIRLGSPRTDEVALFLGKISLKQQNYFDAEQFFQKVLDFNPKERNDYDKSAVKWIARTKELWAGDLITRAVSSEERGKDPEAMFFYSKVVEKFPNSAALVDALFGIAGVHHRHEMFEKEKETLELILKKFPKDRRIRKEVESKLSNINA